MNFAEELRAKRDKTVEEKAKQFAEDMKEKIIKSAEGGYTGYRYKIHKEQTDGHMLRSHDFAKRLQNELDGVKVQYKIEEKTSLIGGLKFYEHYLDFDWNDYGLTDEQMELINKAKMELVE